MDEGEDEEEADAVHKPERMYNEKALLLVLKNNLIYLLICKFFRVL